MLKQTLIVSFLLSAWMVAQAHAFGPARPHAPADALVMTGKARVEGKNQSVELVYASTDPKYQYASLGDESFPVTRQGNDLYVGSIRLGAEQVTQSLELRVGPSAMGFIAQDPAAFAASRGLQDADEMVETCQELGGKANVFIMVEDGSYHPPARFGSCAHLDTR